MHGYHVALHGILELHEVVHLGLAVAYIAGHTLGAQGLVGLGGTVGRVGHCGVEVVVARGVVPAIVDRGAVQRRGAVVLLGSDVEVGVVGRSAVALGLGVEWLKHPLGSLVAGSLAGLLEVEGGILVLLREAIGGAIFHVLEVVEYQVVDALGQHVGVILHHVAHLAGHVVPQLVGVVDAVCALSSDLEHAVLDAAVAALHAVDLVHQLGLGLAHDLEGHVGHVAVLGHIGHLGAHLKGLVACSGEHGSGVVVDVDALRQGLDGGLHERGILAVVGIVFHNLGELLGHDGQHELVGQCHGRVDIGVHVHTLRAQGLDGEFHAVGRVAHVHIDHGASLALGLLGGEVGLGSEVAGHVHIGLAAIGALGIANAEPAGHALAGVGLGHAPPQVGVAQVGSVAVLDAKGVDAGGRGHVGA